MIRVVLYSAFIGIGIWIGSMAVDDVHPYVYDASQSQIIPNPAKQGQMIIADWSIKVNKICPGSVQRFFRDVEKDRLIAALDTTPKSRGVKAGDTRLPRSFELPPNLPPHVGYSALICSECNLLQLIKPLCFMTPEITFRMAD